MGNLLHDIITSDGAERLRPRQRLNLKDWTSAVNYTIDGNPCNLDRIPYVRGVYEDECSTYVFRKGSQVAVTSWALAKAMHGADEHGMRWIYFLPTDTEMDDFVADRVRGVIEASPHLQSRMGTTDNTGLKKIGAGLIYFRGLWTKRRAKSVPADGLIFDEVDEINPENIAFGEDRVLASAWQMKIYLSVPSFSDTGIDKLFKDTDQRFYLIKCAACNHWNNIDEEFPQNFLPVTETHKRTFPEHATHYRGCSSCGQRLRMTDGEWVAKRPSEARHGYHVSRLVTMVYPPDYPNAATFLMDEFSRSQGSQARMSRWEIAFRGYPYDGEGARITDELLNSLEGFDGFSYTGAQGCFMGVDQGDNLDIGIYQRIGRDLKLIYCEQTQQWDRLDDLMERYNITLAGIDGNPNRNSAKRFATKYRKRAFIQDFVGDQLQDRLTVFEGREECRWVTIDRTQSLDATVDFVESGRLILPNSKRLTGRDLTNYGRYRQHLRNLKSKIEETPTVPRRVYLRNVPNHQGMALNTARIAAFELGVKQPVTGATPIFMDWEGTA